MRHSNTYITHSMSIKAVNRAAAMLGITASKANLPWGVRSCQRWREGRHEMERGKIEPPVTHQAAPLGEQASRRG